jgi:hypothetical protein
MPDAALLKPQPAPKCEAKRQVSTDGAARATSADASPGKAAAIDDAARLRKLDYEAQCYRHAEMIARSRLARLQESVQEMVRAKPKPSAAESGPTRWQAIP